MYSRAFWVDAFERALRTVAQTALAILTVDQTDVLAVNWQGVFTASAFAGLLSLLMSIVASRTGNNSTASLVTTAEDKEYRQ